MSSKTARDYRDRPVLPSARKKARAPRSYRTRPDPFAAVWPEVERWLRDEPRLRAKTLFDWLRQTDPGQFLDSHRRTFERRVRQWRATHGPSRTIIFRQVHQPGDVAASDFTSMNALGVTITVTVAPSTGRFWRRGVAFGRRAALGAEVVSASTRGGLRGAP